MDLLQQLWAWLADPNVAYLLLVGGILAAVAAWSTPGTGLAEGLAVLLLGLALIGLLRLPVSAAGLFLILLGALLLLAELYFQSGGFWGLSGALALGLGGLFLLPPGTGRRVAPMILLGATTAAAAASFGLAFLMRQLRRRPPLHRPERLIGAEGIAQTDLDPEGTVWVQGETWTARTAGERIPAGERVRVLAVQGLRLHVARARPPTEPESPSSTEPSNPPVPLDPPGPAVISSGMAVLLAVHFLALLEARALPELSSSSSPDALRIAQQISEGLANRSPEEQALSMLPLALLPIAFGTSLALLQHRLRSFPLLRVVRRILTALMLGGLGLALWLYMDLLLTTLLGPIPRWAELVLLGLAFGLVLWRRPPLGWVRSNVIGGVLCTGGAVYLGHLLTPLAAAAVLLTLILYDVVAVYFSKHMQRLAKWALEERLPLMFVIPLISAAASSSNPALVLGFGDVMLPTSLTLMAFRAHPTPWPAVGALVGALLGHTLLSIRFLPKRGSHAGLPFLAGGALLGYGLGGLLERLG